MQGWYKCNHPTLEKYITMVQSLIQGFEDVQFEHVMRLHNGEANEMAQAVL